MADTTAQLIEKYGGEAISAPSMQELPLEKHEAVFDFAEELFAGAVDVVLFTTGVGTHMVMDTLDTRYDLGDVVEALSQLAVVARGPKPAGALTEYDVPVSVKVPEPNTWEEVLEVMTTDSETVPLDGKWVAVQEYGRPNPDLNDALRAEGAELLRVPIYRWALPDDLEPLKSGLQALIDREAEVAVFTSRQQVDHVLQVAAEQGWEASVRQAFDEVLVASVGPVTSEALAAHDIEVDYEPERPKLGILIRGLAEEASRPLGHETVR